jgi:hypothetical protein
VPKNVESDIQSTQEQSKENRFTFSEGTSGCHDQAYAKWIVIRGLSCGPNDTPFGRPAPSNCIFF